MWRYKPMEFPIYGVYVAEDGIKWRFRITDESTVDQWRDEPKKVGKRRWVASTYFIEPTRGLLDFIKQRYDLEIKLRA